MSTSTLRKAIFLDKDGTILEDVPYNVDPTRMRLAPGARTGLRLLQEAGFRLIVVTNQSGVARGLFPEEELVGVEARLRELLGDAGISLDSFYYCPHHPEGSVAAYARECSCRKPAPGLLFRAARQRQIDLAHSWMVGDKPTDAEAGARAGCRVVAISGANPEIGSSNTTDLAGAAELILSLTRSHGLS
jgi:D-glycero-D-manno-heptose 1,7-bisphosphate phosphatase